MDLSRNKLTNIQVDQLNIGGLKRLQLAHNSISLLVTNCFSSALERLDISFNLLEDIPSGAFGNLEELVDLNLSGNKLKAVTLDFSLPNLASLDLSQNFITSIPRNTFSKFLELTHLKLGYNSLTFISGDVFSRKNHILLNLELHGNKLVTLNRELSDRLESSGQITIGGNPFSCACLWDIMKHLRNKGLNQPDCDSSYLSSGDAAVCVVMNVECDGNEVLTSQQYEEFNKSLKLYTCGKD